MNRVLLALLLMPATPVQACSPAELFALVAERLSYMPAVAEYKYQRDLPVTDMEREQRVAQSTAAQARELGISSASLAPFIRAQIEAAKVIQRELIQRWLRQGRRHEGGSVDLIAAIRPRLNRLGQRQLLAIQCLDQRGLRVETGHRQSFDLAIAEASLPQQTADDLFQSLLLIKND